MSAISVETISTILVLLDHTLTNAPFTKCQDNRSQQECTIAAFCDWKKEQYYLSDGGYSRVWIDPCESTVFLSGVSLPSVRGRWGNADVQLIVAELKKLFVEKLHAELTEHDPPVKKLTRREKLQEKLDDLIAKRQAYADAAFDLEKAMGCRLEEIGERVDTLRLDVDELIKAIRHEGVEFDGDAEVTE